jgi:hypothetical protein
MRSRPLRAGSGHRNMLDAFPFTEAKVPGALTLHEALLEARIARAVHRRYGEVYGEVYGELARMPLPLLVGAHDPSATQVTCRLQRRRAVRAIAPKPCRQAFPPGLPPLSTRKKQPEAIFGSHDRRRASASAACSFGAVACGVEPPAASLVRGEGQAARRDVSGSDAQRKTASNTFRRPLGGNLQGCWGCCAESPSSAAWPWARLGVVTTQSSRHRRSLVPSRANAPIRWPWSCPRGGVCARGWRRSSVRRGSSTMGSMAVCRCFPPSRARRG